MPRKAFTLIELLVVIAIISLLVSMLLPSLKKAKDLARQAVCSTNLRSIAVATQFYTADNNETYPYIGSRCKAPDGGWFYPMYNRLSGLEVIQHFYLESNGAFICPADESVETDQPCNEYSTCYGVNGSYDHGRVFGYCNPGNLLGEPVRIGYIPAPSRRLMVADATAWLDLRRGKLWPHTQAVEGRHGGGKGDEQRAGIVFVDGHVETDHVAHVVNDVDDNGQEMHQCDLWDEPRNRWP